MSDGSLLLESFDEGSSWSEIDTVEIDSTNFIRDMVYDETFDIIFFATNRGVFLLNYGLLDTTSTQ